MLNPILIVCKCSFLQVRISTGGKSTPFRPVRDDIQRVAKQSDLAKTALIHDKFLCNSAWMD
jgi:hypothetical protein